MNYINTICVRYEAIACRLMSLALLLFSPSLFATCAPISLPPIGKPAITYTGGSDGISPGTSIDGYSTYIVKQDIFFDLGDCPGSRLVAYPIKTPIPGVTYNHSKAGAIPVYPTGVEGIGYAIAIAAPSAIDGSWVALQPPSAQFLDKGQITSKALGIWTQGAIVATGRLKSGTYTIPKQNVATVKAFSPTGTTPLTATDGIIQLDAITITINAGTCKMTTASEQLVRLPTINQSALAATGATAGNGSPFRIGVNCDANVALHVTMTDASNTASTNNILSLASGSTAKGVGVQVYRDGLSTPVAYGPDSSVKGNTNQWKVGSSSVATSYDIPFTAAYVRTGDVTPGSVLTKATFTFSYQ